MTQDQVRHIFRSDTDVPMPLIEERHRILNETGKILLEKFEGSFLNCVQKSDKSAQKLLHLVVESFPSYRDVTQFEVSCFCLGISEFLLIFSFTSRTHPLSQWPHPQHIQVPRPGIASQTQLQPMLQL